MTGLMTVVASCEHPSSAGCPRMRIGMRVFISYRRNDTMYLVPELRAALVQVVGIENVFLDIDDVPLGKDYRVHLHEEVSRADAVLAVIGLHWGCDQLANPRDFVRIELLAAHELGKLIIPVLVAGQHMPAESDLPSELGWLAWRNAFEVAAPPRHSHDIERLAAQLSRLALPSLVDRSPTTTHSTRIARSSISAVSRNAQARTDAGWRRCNICGSASSAENAMLYSLCPQGHLVPPQ